MRIAICDDEEKVRKALINKVSKLFPDDEVKGFASGDDLLSSKEQPDILLLDIKMPGMSGLEVARKLRIKNERMVLIFVTGEEEYVYDAFDVQAFHFLVKPISEDRLNEVLERAKEHYLKHVGAKKKYTMITSGGTHIRLCLNDVVYAEVFNSKVIVHTVDEDIEYYGKLTDLEKLAGEDFFRTHRGFLVNLNYVIKYDASNIYFDKGCALVSKQNYPAFVQRLMKYNTQKGLFV